MQWAAVRTQQDSMRMPPQVCLKGLEEPLARSCRDTCQGVCYSENFAQRGTGDFAQQGTGDNFTTCIATLSVNSTVKQHSTELRYSIVW
ncbi:unnamed protein product [Merluccius merluccius]